MKCGTHTEMGQIPLLLSVQPSWDATSGSAENGEFSPPPPTHFSNLKIAQIRNINFHPGLLPRDKHLQNLSVSWTCIFPEWQRKMSYVQAGTGFPLPPFRRATHQPRSCGSMSTANPGFCDKRCLRT